MFILKVVLFVVPVGVWLYFAYHAKRSFLGKFGYLAILGGAILTPLSGINYLEERSIAEHGVATQAFPTNTFQESKSWLGDSYLSTVSYKTNQGEVVSERRGVSQEVMDLFRSGKPVTLSYLPDDPKTMRVHGMGSQALKLLLDALMCFAAGAALLAIQHVVARKFQN
jgi:hypothetical protein